MRISGNLGKKESIHPKAHWTLIARVLTLTARVLDLKHVAVGSGPGSPLGMSMFFHIHQSAKTATFDDTPSEGDRYLTRSYPYLSMGNHGLQ